MLTTLLAPFCTHTHKHTCAHREVHICTHLYAHMLTDTHKQAYSPGLRSMILQKSSTHPAVLTQVILIKLSGPQTRHPSRNGLAGKEGSENTKAVEGFVQVIKIH